MRTYENEMRFGTQIPATNLFSDQSFAEEVLIHHQFPFEYGPPTLKPKPADAEQFQNRSKAFGGVYWELNNGFRNATADIGVGIEKGRFTITIMRVPKQAKALIVSQFDDGNWSLSKGKNTGPLKITDVRAGQKHILARKLDIWPFLVLFSYLTVGLSAVFCFVKLRVPLVPKFPYAIASAS